MPEYYPDPRERVDVQVETEDLFRGERPGPADTEYDAVVADSDSVVDDADDLFPEDDATNRSVVDDPAFSSEYVATVFGGPQEQADRAQQDAAEEAAARRTLYRQYAAGRLGHRGTMSEERYGKAVEDVADRVDSMHQAARTLNAARLGLEVRLKPTVDADGNPDQYVDRARALFADRPLGDGETPEAREAHIRYIAEVMRLDDTVATLAPGRQQEMAAASDQSPAEATAAEQSAAEPRENSTDEPDATGTSDADTTAKAIKDAAEVPLLQPVEAPEGLFEGRIVDEQHRPDTEADATDEESATTAAEAVAREATTDPDATQPEQTETRSSDTDTAPNVTSEEAEPAVAEGTTADATESEAVEDTEEERQRARFITVTEEELLAATGNDSGPSTGSRPADTPAPDRTRTPDRGAEPPAPTTASPDSAAPGENASAYVPDETAQRLGSAAAARELADQTPHTVIEPQSGDGLPAASEPIAASPDTAASQAAIPTTQPGSPETGTPPASGSLEVGQAAVSGTTEFGAPLAAEPMAGDLSDRTSPEVATAAAGDDSLATPVSSPTPQAGATAAAGGDGDAYASAGNTTAGSGDEATPAAATDPGAGAITADLERLRRILNDESEGAVTPGEGTGEGAEGEAEGGGEGAE